MITEWVLHHLKSQEKCLHPTLKQIISNPSKTSSPLSSQISVKNIFFFPFSKSSIAEPSPKNQNYNQFPFSPLVSKFYRHANSSNIGFPIPFTPKNICTPTPIANNLNSANPSLPNKSIEEGNLNEGNSFGKDMMLTTNSNIKKFDKIINELKNNIESNAAKFDRTNNDISLDLNLIGETYNDVEKQYLQLESNKRKFMVSPNSPFVMHIKSSRNQNS